MSNRIDRVVITGASSGIGFDMARRFLAEGSQLLINARNPRSSRRPGAASRAGGGSWRRWSHMKRYILYAIAILATWTLIDAVGIGFCFGFAGSLHFLP